MPRAEGQRKHPQLNARPPALASAAEQLAAGWMDGQKSLQQLFTSLTLKAACLRVNLQQNHLKLWRARDEEGHTNGRCRQPGGSGKEAGALAHSLRAVVGNGLVTRHGTFGAFELFWVLNYYRACAEQEFFEKMPRSGKVLRCILQGISLSLSHKATGRDVVI